MLYEVITPLPQAHSDFVFTVVGEESGLFGVFFVIVLFIVFFLKGLSIAKKQDSDFKAFIAGGFSCTIFFQAMLNMGVVSGLLPPTGIPLPFFSQGGTSILVTMIMIGFRITSYNVCYTKLLRKGIPVGGNKPETTPMFNIA